MPVVLGVDSSTQSCKVEVRDADTGDLLGSGTASHPGTTPPVSEQDPNAWWRALREAIAGALADGRPDAIDALAVAGQQHGAVLVDGAGRVVRPAKLWNDTTSAPQAVRLVEQLGADAWAARCGSVPVASFTITKLAWLAEHEPESLRRAASVLLPHDWLTWHLSGRAVTDRGDASGTGYWSPADGAWDVGLLAAVDDRLDWPALLPDVLGPTDAVGVVAPGVAADLGLTGQPIVAPGTGDNMAAALGVALAPDDLMVSLGTSGTASTVAVAPTHDASGSVAGFADATGRFLPLVCTLNATGATAHVALLLGVDLPAFDALALEAGPGAGGITFLPYLDGERTPDRPDARAVLAGISGRTGRAEVARAAVEGVVCGLLDGVDALASATGRDLAHGRLVVVGGGARSPAFVEVIAGLANRPVDLPPDTEAAAAGACVQAAAVLHGRSPGDVAAAWGLGAAATRHQPARDAGSWAEVRGRYAARRDAEA